MSRVSRDGRLPHRTGRRPGSARFSTVGLPVARRLELWEEYNARALIGLSCKTINDAPLEATEHNLWLPNVELAEVTGNSHVVERTVRQIDRYPAHSVVLYVAMAGEAFFYQEDGVRTVRPGQAVLCDADVPFMRGFAQGLTELALKMPRILFEGLAESPSRQAPRVFDLTGAPGANSHGRALAELMRSALRGGPGHDRQRLENDVLGLLRAMVVGAGAGDARSQLHAAQAFIERHLTDRALSAPHIAAGIGISERQLSRVFGELHGVARWIADRRLDLAHDMLTSNDADRLSVADVARGCGFSSQSYFARVFKRRFAQTPLDVRRQAAGRGDR